MEKRSIGKIKISESQQVLTIKGGERGEPREQEHPLFLLFEKEWTPAFLGREIIREREG